MPLPSTYLQVYTPLATVVIVVSPVFFNRPASSLVNANGADESSLGEIIFVAELSLLVSPL
jgi:hypothetical protein